MKLRWTARARADLLEITRYIADDDPSAAARWARNLRARARNAARMPRAGRVVPEMHSQNLREVIVGNYRLVYRVGDGSVEVLTVFEGHRRIPISPRDH